MWHVDFQKQACILRSISLNSSLPSLGSINNLHLNWICTQSVRMCPLPHKQEIRFLSNLKFFPHVLMFSFVLFSYCGNQPLKDASKYFAKQGIPFPTKVPDDQETPHLKECYIVGDKESPETPIVIFFPLVNDTFREYKAPGKFTVTHHINRGSGHFLSLFLLHNNCSSDLNSPCWDLNHMKKFIICDLTWTVEKHLGSAFGTYFPLQFFFWLFVSRL